jgi:N-acetylmuramoyl-L-alanine amidase
MNIDSASKLSLALLFTALLSAVPASAQNVVVEISADGSASSMRLVLTHSRQVTYDILASDKKVEIIYAEPVKAIPAENRLEDPILKRFFLEDDHRIVLRTGPGFRAYESFELNHPFRLVIDLLGSREGALAENNAPPRHDPDKTIIVIDPGHGGIEQGAVGPSGLREKDIALDLAQRLKSALEKDPALSVVLTRDEDRLVGLDERTAIANHNRADLFLSIHLNASRRTSARGAETYFLSSDATDDEARTLAALENRASGVDEESVYSKGKESNGLELVLWDLAQNQYLAESSVLAESMQRHLNELTGTRDRGVRQAPFRVLMGATMPAILVEAGFISNPKEEQLFKSLGYRNQVVSAMAAAVHDFLRDLDKLSRPASSGAAEKR